MYNTKYILNFCNRDRVPVRVEIQIKDYVGEAFILVNDGQYLLDNDGRYVTANIDGSYDPDRDMSAIEGGASPFVLNYMNDVGDKTGAIRASSADMKFYENMLFNIDDLATSDETEIRVQLFYDDEIEWIGFVTPDFFNVEITPNPLINLTASDRIGILKDVPYALTSDIEERVRLIDIVSNILKETGLELNINILCQMYCDEFPERLPPGDIEPYEANNPFLDVWVSEYRFADDLDTLDTDDCYSILQSILNQFNCFLTQYKGEWWIINKQDQELGGGVIFVFDADGQYQSMGRSEFGERTFSLIDTGGQRTIMPAFSRVTLNLDHGENVIYPVNRTLRAKDNTNVDLWTKNPSPTVSYEITPNVTTEYNPDGTVKDYYVDSRRWFRNTECIYYASSDPDPIITWVDDQGYFVIESSKFPIPTLDTKKMSFDFTVRAIGKPNSAIVLMLGIEFDDPFYKYAGLRYFSEGDTGYFFTFSKTFGDNGPYTNITTGPTNNTLTFRFEDKYANTNIAVEQEFKITVHAAQGQLQSGLDLTKAKMFIRVYPNKTWGSVENTYYTSAIIKEIKVDFLSDNQTPTDTVFQSRLQANYTKVRDVSDVMYGDYQMYGQNGFFYRYREDSLSIQYNSLGERLQSWYTKTDSERNPILIHSLRQIAKSTSRAYDELKIGFDMGNINPLCQYAVRCVSDKKILVDPDDKYLTDNDGRYIEGRIGRYLNNKKYVFVEGSIDYLTSHFSGVLAQIPQSSIEREEYIYSILESNGNN